MTYAPTDKCPTKTDYLIIGGGVAGCALTYALSKRGARVILVTKDEVGAAGASSVPVALLNPYRGRSARASELDLAGLAAMRQLAKELDALGLEHGVRFSGALRLASNRKQAKTWRKREGVRWLEPEEVPPVYHAPFGGFLVEDGGWLEPRTFLRALLTASKYWGANVLEGCEVSDVGEDGTYQQVKMSGGTLQARTLIFCTGADTPLVDMKLMQIAGEVIGLETRARLPRALAGAVYGAQLSGQVYLGGNHRDAEQVDESAPQQLQRAGSWFVPALKEAALTSVWTGVRAKTEDNAPVTEEVRPHRWFFGALAGRGFLCAAHLAEGLAEQLINSKRRYLET